MFSRHIITGSFLTLFAMSKVFASCGSAFCSINTQWDVQGVTPNTGTQIGLRYENIDQDQLREGRDKVSIDAQADEEHAEVETLNHNWFLSVDHAINETWGISIAIPYVDRFHEHIEDPQGAADDETWDFNDLGDIKVMGKYQSASNKTGLQFGLKLPTGDYDVSNADGEVAERSLQPGSGTTDAILGVFYRSHSLKSSLSWFTQAQLQQALNERAGYKPGSQFSLNGGYNYAANHKVSLMVQLNGLVKGKDSGNEAEPADSGGEFIFLTPGISVAITSSVQVYAFFQQPLYQYVNGIQLTSDNSYTVGINGQF
jgi:Putative MetA-pathway of phenol degradation